jgi:hypothetical protein
MEDCNQRWIPVGTNDIMVKAHSMLSSLEGHKFTWDATMLSASRGRAEKFKAPTGMHNVKLTGEVANVDRDAAAKFPARFKDVIEENY